MKILSRIEELILLTVWQLEDEAYGIPIRNKIIKLTGKKWSVGAIYVPLDRLVKWGFLISSQSKPTAERGGRSKRYYKISSEGLDALTQVKRMIDLLRMDLPETK
jgi:PadR family transcriptional regulator PadR